MPNTAHLTLKKSKKYMHSCTHVPGTSVNMLDIFLISFTMINVLTFPGDSSDKV